MNQIKDQHGSPIKEGDIVRFYDSTTMWLESVVIDVGGALAVKTDENPILLYEFAMHVLNDEYVYDGSPIKELEIVPVCEQKG